MLITKAGRRTITTTNDNEQNLDKLSDVCTKWATYMGVLLITGLDYWTGPLDWTHIFWFLHILVFTHSEVIFVMSLKTKGLQGAFYPWIWGLQEEKNAIWVTIVRCLVALMLVFCLFQTIYSYFLSKKLYCYNAHVCTSYIITRLLDWHIWFYSYILRLLNFVMLANYTFIWFSAHLTLNSYPLNLIHDTIAAWIESDNRCLGR